MAEACGIHNFVKTKMLRSCLGGVAFFLVSRNVQARLPSHSLFSVRGLLLVQASPRASSLSRSSSNAPRNEKRFVKNVSASSQRRGSTGHVLFLLPFSRSPFLAVYGVTCYTESCACSWNAIKWILMHLKRSFRCRWGKHAARHVPFNFSNLFNGGADWTPLLLIDLYGVELANLVSLPLLFFR